MELEKVSIPVNFDLSQLKIRCSDHLLVKEGEKVLGEAVVYGGDWEKAERLARQIAERKFGEPRGDLVVCEQVFISDKLQATSYKQDIKDIQMRRSNLKVKVGRNVFDDVKTLNYIRNELEFPYKIRIDANQGYSLKQLHYFLPTLIQCGVHFVEEPVRRSELPTAVRLLHDNRLKVILDETIQTRIDWEWAVKNKLIDVLNLKLARVGDIDEAIWYIKQAKKHGVKIIVGCSEELERGTKAIYAFGHIAKKEGVLLEVEGFGPLRLEQRATPIPRFINRLENAWLMFSHRMKQGAFGGWWSAMRLGVKLVKESKKLSALSLRLVQLTGKHKEKIHPKHLIAERYPPKYLEYIKKNDRVLDVGCGNGQHTLRVAHCAEQVVGFDVSNRDLEIARNTAKEQGIENVRFETNSAENRFPYQSSSFEKVLCLGVLEHLVNRDATLGEIYRVLTPRGKLLLGVPNRQTSWKKHQEQFGVPSFTDPDHKIEYSKKEIEDELSRNGFKILSMFLTAFDTPYAGFIDFIGGISLKVYDRLIRWKWRMAEKHPEDSISWFIVAGKV